MWNRYYQHCVTCKQTDVPYMAKGMCKKCYLAEYRRDPVNQLKAKSHKRKWYEENWQGTDRGKLAREQRNFSGMREVALERDGFQCVKCGSSEKLTVHHKDGNGRGSQNPNNSMDNLETLCRACHIAEHRTELLEARARSNYRKPKLGRWSRKHDKCARCGTTGIKHSAHGYCRTCIFHYKKSSRYSPNSQATARGRQK